jgi:hypothetical protein
MGHHCSPHGSLHHLHLLLLLLLQCHVWEHI